MHLSPSDTRAIIELYREHNIKIGASIFTLSAAFLRKNIAFIKENYGPSYLTLAIVPKSTKQIKTVLPYLEQNGMLEPIKTNANILLYQ